MKTLVKQITNSEKFQDLMKQWLSKPQIYAGGMIGSLLSVLAASMLNSLQNPLLIVVPSAGDAEILMNDLATLLGRKRAAYMPPTDIYAYESSSLAMGPRNERIDALLRFRQTDSMAESLITVTQPEALIEKSPDQDWIEKHIVKISYADTLVRDELLIKLTQSGYKRERVVDQQGQFAVRGGLIDIYPFGFENPFRIELEGDEVFSLREFDSVTQRSSKELDEITLLIGDDTEITDSGVFNLLPQNSLIIWYKSEEIEQRISQFVEKNKKFQKKADPGEELPFDHSLQSLDELLAKAAPNKQLIVSELKRGNLVDIDFDSVKPEAFTGAVDELPKYFSQYIPQRIDIWMTTDAKGERDHLREQFFDEKLDQVRVVTPMLSAGFICHSANVCVLTTREIFRRRRQRAQHTRFRRRSAIQFDRTALANGDLVVHAEYGIGRYEGLQMVKVTGHPRECLRIQYADNLLFIPIEHFGMVEKYSGMENARPTLSKIGGNDWDRAKKRTQKAIKDMTDELLKLYSKRKIVKGIAFPPDTPWQTEMESSFEFEDTPDQTTATSEIKGDLESSHPMDRLLCGDVGFGKTEVAIRAAFKVVQESHQVAVLVPTTILAQQHYETFRERLAAYPIKIDVLSRFRTTAESKEIKLKLKEGETDILIGTHRLLSRDVEFKNLGLLIVDEEHRFGVAHKERIKQMKTNVDVLTMTATPIPRTLNMALMGARDTSQINTPPVDRLPIQTEVHGWSEELIRNAILREVDREGQVFFLHNRVQSIFTVKEMLERLVPGVRFAVGHGQMPERQLEKVMFEFMHGKYDVLVTTMIIESGLDIPNANTLIVNRADCFGLAQLYQLRGRIGRSSRQAYAYLLTPPKLTISTTAIRRLSTMTELTDLGSGMKVAMRDLEIRGAGNILGSQQSGFISAVGFDMYTKMLSEITSKARGEEFLPDEDESKLNVRIDWSGPALIPVEYIDDSDLRYGFYRQMAKIKNLEEIDALQAELRDRFGQIPQQTGNLLTLTRLKTMGKMAGFSRIKVGKKAMVALLKLPPDPSESQKKIGLLISQAAPEKVELRMTNPLELIYPIKSNNSLEFAEKFLRHLTRKGILQD